MKLYVKCNKSQRSGKLYHALYVDFGYRSAVLTMDTAIIVEMCGITFAQLFALKENEQIAVALNVTK